MSPLARMEESLESLDNVKIVSILVHRLEINKLKIKIKIKNKNKIKIKIKIDGCESFLSPAKIVIHANGLC
jgi:hypothetical protein